MNPIPQSEKKFKPELEQKKLGRNKDSSANNLKRDYHARTKRRRFMSVIDPIALDVNAAYLAGLFDGEGTFTIRTKKAPFTPQIEICMTDEETIKFAAEQLGVDYKKILRERPYKDVYALRVYTKREIHQIVKALIPYSKTKQEQMQLLLKYFELNEILAKKRSDSKIMEEIADLCVKVKKRNERGEPPDYVEMRKQLLSALANHA